MPKYAGRRDNNDSSLRAIAERLGWWLIQTDEPTDYIGVLRGVYNLIEIKNPDCEGHADEYTDKQKIFHQLALNRGAPILVWRTENDILRDSQARRSA